MDKEKSSKSGISFCGLLTIVFITLKLTNYINWSWVWVVSPLWIPFAVVGVIFVIFLVVGAIIAATNSDDGDEE